MLAVDLRFLMFAPVAAADSACDVARCLLGFCCAFCFCVCPVDCLRLLCVAAFAFAFAFAACV